MGETGNPERFTSRVDRPLALVNGHYGIGQEALFTPIALDALKQSMHVGNHRHAADLPVLGSGRRVAQNCDFPFLKVAVPAVDAGRLALAATAVRQKLHEVGATLAPSAVRSADERNQLPELVLAGKLQEPLPNLLAFDVDGRVVIPRPRLNRQAQNQLERADSVVEGRRAGLPKPRSPREAIAFGDLGHVGLLQFGPRFQQSGDAFLAVGLAAVF